MELTAVSLGKQCRYRSKQQDASRLRNIGSDRRHSNRIGKPHCFNGFQVALNMLRPAFWSPAESAREKGKYVVVYRREPACGWKIVIDMYSNNV